MAPTESKYDAAANPRLDFADANGDGRLDVLFPGAAAIGSAPSRLVLGNSINGDFGGADVATWTVPPPVGGWSDCGFGAFQVGALSRDWLLVGPDQTGMVKSSFSVVGAGGSASLPVFPITGPTFGSVGTGGGAVCAGIADVDGDGNADIGLALTTAAARSFMIAYGKGDRTFRSAMTTLARSSSQYASRKARTWIWLPSNAV